MSDGKSIWLADASGGEIRDERPTMRLRYSKSGVLQQAWMQTIRHRKENSTTAVPTFEWRDIPTEG